MAFHPYPQLIRAVFNRHRFGPPRGITPASTWPWVDHAVSGLTHATGAQGHALFGLAFATPPRLGSLKLATHVNSQAHSAKGTPSPVPGKPGIGLRLLVGDAVSGTISLPSRGAFHLSLTVLLRYRWQGVFSLGRWSSRIPAGFLVSRGTWVPSSESGCLSPTGLSPSVAPFSNGLG